TSAPIDQGSLPISHVRQTDIVGNKLYVATSNAFQIWDVSAAMDEDAGTKVDAGAPLGSLPIHNSMAISAYGNYVYLSTFVATGQPAPYQDGTYAIEVSNPASPRVVGYAPLFGDYYGCGYFVTVHHSSVSVHGTRLYLNSNENNWI